MNGRELARHARALLPSLPILLTSGYAPDEARPERDSLLSKPFDLPQLAASVHAALDARHKSVDAAATDD